MYVDILPEQRTRLENGSYEISLPAGDYNQQILCLSCFDPNEAVAVRLVGTPTARNFRVLQMRSNGGARVFEIEDCEIETLS